MIRLVIFFLAVLIAAAGLAWIADRPGDIVLTWQGYRYETSLLAAGVMVMALVIVLMLLWTGLRVLIGLPGAFSGFLHNRRKAKGYQALSRGMIAVGTGDARQAARYSDQASRALSGEPLALLLRAQTAQLSGNTGAARKTFEAMLGSPDTESLGLRGLFIEAQRRGDATAMRGYAERALALDPETGWAAIALFDMQCAAHDWAGALATLQESLVNRHIDKQTAKRQRAVLLTARALEREDSEPDTALAYVLEAAKLAPDLVPAVALAGRLLSESGNVRRALRVLEKGWKVFPHPEIAEAYINARAGDSVRDRLKRIKALVNKGEETRTGAIALAEAAIDARDWAAARNALKPYLEDGLTQHICSLMAEIEDGEHGDAGRVRAWLARAVHAPRDPAWTADGIVAEQWAPVSPVTGRLDAFAWKVPVEDAAPLRGLPPRTDAAPLAGAAAEIAPPDADKTGAKVPPAPADSDGPKAGKAAAKAPAQPAPARDDPDGAVSAKAATPAKTAAAPPAKRAKAGSAPAGAGDGKASGGEVFPARAPDDPGPDGDPTLDDDAPVPQRRI